MLDREQLEFALIDSIPLHTHLGIRLATEGRPLDVELEDLPQTRNHLGGQGGAALFGVGEAAGAAAMFDLLAASSDQVFAVPAEACIRFHRPARGGVVAHARFRGNPEAATAAARQGRSATVEIGVELRDGDGELVAELDARWHLAQLRPGGRPAVPRQPA